MGHWHFQQFCKNIQLNLQPLVQEWQICHCQIHSGVKVKVRMTDPKIQKNVLLQHIFDLKLELNVYVD